MRASITDDERAGAVEPFEDAALYDWEYRRRRNDIAFYRMLADERGGPVLDLGCGTGRLAVPLARDGHRVVGVDLSASMLGAAATRRRRLSRAAANRCHLLRADLRALPLRGHFPFAVSAFHTIQHLIDDREICGFLRHVRRLIEPDGWFAFDVFFPEPEWLARAPNREFDRTVFRHPGTGQKLAYSVSHRLDTQRRALHMKLHYKPVDAQGTSQGRGRIVRLCHRQLPPIEVEKLLRRSGLRILKRWGGFAGESFPSQTDGHAGDPPTEQHVYLAGPLGRRRPLPDQRVRTRDPRRQETVHIVSRTPERDRPASACAPSTVHRTPVFPACFDIPPTETSALRAGFRLTPPRPPIRSVALRGSRINFSDGGLRMAEKVEKLGVNRDKDFMYYVKDAAVWRVQRKQPGVPKGRPEKVADGTFQMDTDFIYFVDKDGDVSRAKRAVGGQKRKKSAAKKSSPKKSSPKKSGAKKVKVAKSPKSKAGKAPKGKKIKAGKAKPAKKVVGKKKRR